MVSAQSAGKEKGLEIDFSCVANDSINQGYEVRTSHWRARRVMCPKVMEAQCNPPDLVPYVSFVWFWFVSFITKLMESRALPWVLWIVLSNYWTWGVSGNPCICNQLVTSVSGPWDPQHLQWGEGSGVDRWLWPVKFDLVELRYRLYA